MISSDLGLVDFHSHFLPAIDDGAKDAEMSYHMLTDSSCCSYVVATPHFYGDENPDTFIEKRRTAFESIMKTDKKVAFGAEVYCFPSMGRSEALRKFCIGSTSLVLVEMPFVRWSDREIEELINIHDNLSLVPVLAHFERYLSSQKKGTIEHLAENGVLIQSNTGYFLDDFKEAYGYLRSGLISFLGSDMHNTGRRKPDFEEVVSLIAEKKGVSCLEMVSKNSKALINSVKWK